MTDPDDEELDDEPLDDPEPDAPTGPYATAAWTYLHAGWAPLPLPARCKTPPPTGWTGARAPWPTGPDVQAWTEDHPHGNIALRLPPTVLGIDVDAYAGKPGLATLAAQEARYGQLPATWTSSSRGDGSGIRMYRVPDGLAWPGQLAGGGVELIQARHRYVVAWPSLHPSGGTYTWRGPDSATCPPPGVDDLPALPDAWVEGLTGGEAASDLPRAGLEGDAARAWLGNDASLPCRVVEATLTRAVLDLTTPGASRHDTALRHVQRLAHLHAEGHRGVPGALGHLRAAFEQAVGGDRDISTEWGRMCVGAIDIAAAGHERPQGDPCDNPFAQLHGIIPTPRGITPWTSNAPSTSAATSSSTPSAGPSSRSMATERSKSSAHTTAPPANESPLSSSTPSSPSDSGSAGSTGSTPSTTANTATAADAATATAAAESTSLTADDREHTSWWPRDLTPVITGEIVRPPCTSLLRTDGVALWYPGRVNGLLAPSESGKTWVALHAVLQHLQDGDRVLYLDMEDSADGIVGRLRLMGATEEQLSRLVYIDPDETLHALAAADLAEVLAAGPYGLVLLDGVNAAMSLLGLKINDNNDATVFAQRLLKPFTRTGSVVAAVDHTPKTEDPENASKGGIGAQAKRAAMTGCALRVTVKKQPAPGEVGRLTLHVDKDRVGSVRAHSMGGRWAGTCVIEDGPDGLVQVRIDPPASARTGTGDAADGWQPTHLMTRISRYLEGFAGTGVSGNAIEKEVGGRAGYARKALDALVEGGHVRRSSGARGAVLHHLVNPFNGEEERPRPTSSRPRPDLVPDEVEGDTLDLVPPRPTSQGEALRYEVDEDEVARAAGTTRPRPVTTEGLIDLGGGELFNPHTGEITAAGGGR